jgi:hypothetical protein
LFTLPLIGILILSACVAAETPAPIVSPTEQVDLPTEQSFVTPPTKMPTQIQAPTAEHTLSPASTEPSPPDTNEANADVTFVKATFDQTSETWTFDVTVSHPDTGWEDYADGWNVVGADGTVFKPDPDSPFTRLLLHPHVGEQPFTRNQRGIKIPSDVTIVFVRAHDLISGFGGNEVEVDLNATEGTNFEVTR